jgi:hypothetical protein
MCRCRASLRLRRRSRSFRADSIESRQVMSDNLRPKSLNSGPSRKSHVGSRIMTEM